MLYWFYFNWHLGFTRVTVNLQKNGCLLVSDPFYINSDFGCFGWPHRSYLDSISAFLFYRLSAKESVFIASLMRVNSNSHLGLGSILFGLQWVPYVGFFCFILNLQKSQFSLHLYHGFASIPIWVFSHFCPRFKLLFSGRILLLLIPL